MLGNPALAMSLLWALLMVLATAGMGVYLYFIRQYSYWRRRGVPEGSEPPVFPVGNIGGLFKKQPFGKVCRDIYENTKHLPFVGIYMFHRPALLINDLDLVKTILVKDFMHFTDHGFDFNLESQPLANHLFNTNGTRWKGLRNKLTPAFTSSKMRYMFETIAACGDELNAYLKSYADDGTEFDAKEVVAKFSTNVIVSCAFGLESNCFKNPDTEFRTLGKRVFDMDWKRSLATFMAFFMPDLYKKLDYPIIEDHVSEFFISVVENTIKYREDNKITRNDIMQLLIRLKNNENIDDIGESAKSESQDANIGDVHLNALGLAAQAFGFFVAGFETSSTTISFILYELAKNLDVQSKLRREIEDVLKKYDGKMCYDAIMDMYYINQVIEETLRFHPIVPQMFRVCTKAYTIPNTDVLIEKGTAILIPSEGFYFNSKYFDDPEIFDPEQFSSENKTRRHHFSYLPFGEGPRICIGMRLAQLEIKIALVSILKSYNIELAKDWTMKLVIHASFFMAPKDVYVKLTNRP